MNQLLYESVFAILNILGCKRRKPLRQKHQFWSMFLPFGKELPLVFTENTGGKHIETKKNICEASLQEMNTRALTFFS